MDISLALETLLSAPEGSLESHRGKALSLAETIWSTLSATSNTDTTTSGLHSSCSSESESLLSETSMPRAPSSISSADIVPLSNDRPRPVRRTQRRDLRPQRLLTAMKNKVSDMKGVLETGARAVIERVLITFIDEDGRLSDVTRIIGKKDASNEERLIQCLAQRALALEYTEWELKVRRLKKSRVQELAENLSNTKSQSGHISQYVRECHYFNSEDDAVRTIRYGVKQLLQEKLLSNRLSEGTKCEGIELGIALAYPDFFTLTFDQQELFAELLTNEDSATDILNFLLGQSHWIGTCQAIYNDYKNGSMALPHTARASTNERPAKRRRQDKSASSMSHTSRENDPIQSFRPIQKKTRAACSPPRFSAVRQVPSPAAEPHQNFLDSSQVTHSQTVISACGPACSSDNSASSRTFLERSDLPNEHHALSLNQSVAALNEVNEATPQGSGVTLPESSAFVQYQNSHLFSEQQTPGFINSVGYYDNTRYPPVPFNNPPLVGFSDWGMDNWDLRGFQDISFQPMSGSF